MLRSRKTRTHLMFVTLSCAGSPLASPKFHRDSIISAKRASSGFSPFANVSSIVCKLGTSWSESEGPCVGRLGNWSSGWRMSWSSERVGVSRRICTTQSSAVATGKTLRTGLLREQAERDRKATRVDWVGWKDRLVVYCCLESAGSIR